MAGERPARYFLVREDLLPEAMVKTAQAKHLLARGAASTIFEAVRAVGLSRSAFYKYKDGVFWYDAMQGVQMLVLAMNLDHRTGVLSRVLAELAAVGANILTIHQTIPLQEVAHVTISLEFGALKNGAEGSAISEAALIARLERLEGVSRVEIVGRGSPVQPRESGRV
ncbi:MAG: ACT domain-containing protein [Hydrogenibacillus schlegelii]|nr:ACT domain-containing protein [Hydrogenibacillus schlegelii]